MSRQFLGLLFISTALLHGCASITGSTTQSMRIDTLTEKGEKIDGADCKVSNEYGSISGKSGDTLQVGRSSEVHNIVCKRDSVADASGRAISRSNGGIWGNILFGGGIGAIIDHSKGTGYTYPTWVQLVFGKTLTFDRSNEKEGQPVVGTEPKGANPVASASSPK